MEPDVTLITMHRQNGRARRLAINRLLTSLHDRVAPDNKPRWCLPASHLALAWRDLRHLPIRVPWSYRGCDDMPCSMRCGQHCGLHKGISASCAQYQPTSVRVMNGTITGSSVHPYVHRITQSFALILFADVTNCAHLQHHV